jgi:eukaryotic-like serine/threonine-protein kinase
MTPDRWERLSHLYNATLAHEPSSRAAYLDAACAEDAELRAEIESLLQRELPSVPALDVMATQIGSVSPTAAIGARLGTYRIESLIGEGGMGQVYRAHDAELGRDVAIKVLPSIFALDTNRCARFEREARVLASLNHPNIGAIYGIAAGDGLRGLVLELVEGDTLAERLRATQSDITGAKKLSVRERLNIARQIADALDAAHEKGIVHRDLKPANIKITSDGVVKVLDFGLAKGAAHHDADAAAVNGTAPEGTQAGLVLGTPGYMSPEQAEGRPVDRRTDIWAFGCVLYEIFVGRPPFAAEAGPGAASTLLDQQPDWSALPPIAPRVVELLRRCLEKDPRRRLRDIGEALIALEDTLAAPSASAEIAVDKGRPASWMVVAVIVTAVVAGAAVWNLKPSSVPVSQGITRVAVPVTPEERPAALRGLALSADGRQLAYVSDQAGGLRLCVRAMDGSDAKMLPGTEQSLYPFFSPDGQWIGFFAGGKLKKVPMAGGTVVTLLDLSAVDGYGGSGGVWGSDDTIFFGGGTGIWKVSAAGGSLGRVTAVERSKGEIYHRMPLLLPDGKTLLYVVMYGPGWDEKQIVAQRLGSPEKHLLIRGASTARYTPTGHLIYTRAGTMMAVRFDPIRLEVSGPPVTLLEDLREGTPYADYDVSPDGSLVYVQQSPEARNRIPVLVDRKGVATRLPGLAPAYYQVPTFSPDGRQLALNITESMIDIWVYDFARASLTRVTTEGSSQDPVWSPDGKRLAYRATRSGSRNLFWKSLDGTAAEERLTTSERVQAPWSWSHDGTTVAFEESSVETKTDIWMLPLAGDRKPRPFVREPFEESRPRFSPTGPWLAYVSDQSGRPEVYVRSYPGPGRRWQVSTDGGGEPTWARDGRELFYRNGRKMMSVQIAEGSIFRPSTPRLLFEGDFPVGEPVIDFDVHPDGQRFVMIYPDRPDPPVTHINVVLNWFEELKQRVPAAQ